MQNGARPSQHGDLTAFELHLSGRRQRLHTGENVIGRAPDAEVFLDVASVSRRHAAIVVDGDGAHLRDLGSKNGTRARDRAVEGSVPLDNGDEIGVGTITLVYRRAAGGLPTETQGR